MRPSLCALLAGVILLPEALFCQAPDSSGASRRQISVPQQLGPFKLARQQRYDDPAMGTMFRYLSPDTVPLDVFIYPGPGFDEHCSLECAQRVIDAEAKGFRDGFPMMLERGYVDSIAVTAEDTLHPEDGDEWRLGRSIALRVVQQGEPLRSDFIVWYLPHYRVKLRATYADREPIRTYVRFVTDTLVDAILRRSREVAASRPAAMSVTLAGPPATHLTTLVAQARALGYAIEDSTVRDQRAFLLTAPRTDWTGSAMAERYGTAASPPLQLVGVLLPKGDSTQVNLTARVAPGSETADTATLMPMSLMAVMELISALTEDK